MRPKTLGPGGVFGHALEAVEQVELAAGGGLRGREGARLQEGGAAAKDAALDQGAGQAQGLLERAPQDVAAVATDQGVRTDGPLVLGIAGGAFPGGVERLVEVGV